MARFEVYIPPTEPDGMNMTLRVTADTWMAALKVGLKKIGDAQGIPNNVLCDIQDDESIHVTDPRTNRVFRILQIPEVSNPGLIPAPKGPWMAAPSDPSPAGTDPASEAAAAEKLATEQATATRLAAEKALAEKVAAERAAAERLAAEAKAVQERAAAERATAEKEAAEAKKRAAAALADEAAETDRTASEKVAAERAAKARAAAEKATAEHVAAEKKAAAERAAEAKAKADARVASEKAERERLSREKTERARASHPTIKIVAVAKPKAPPPAVIGRPSVAPGDTIQIEDALADLFERTPELFEKSRDEALYLLLDLAMEKVPVESGTVYVADLNRHDLGFVAVRGPKAAELLALKLRVPMGKGFVGFCAQEGVAIAISDAQRDKRFFREISDRIGYETHSILTTPIILHGRTLGAIQLINKKGSSSFTQGELSVLHYLAHQGALLLEAREEA